MKRKKSIKNSKGKSTLNLKTFLKVKYLRRSALSLSIINAQIRLSISLRMGRNAKNALMKSYPKKSKTFANNVQMFA